MSGTDHRGPGAETDRRTEAASLSSGAKNSFFETHWQRLKAKFPATTHPRKGSVDPAFLPAALEILERPPSPTGRAVVWLVIAAAGFAIAWACIAEVDEVAVAQGRVIPRSRLQTVEPAETGVVRAILVREGQRVEVGQPLIELDPTFADADAASARTEYATAQLARARADALLAQVAGRRGGMASPDGADPAALSAEREAVRARVSALTERVGSIDSRIAGARAEISGAEAERSALMQTLPLVEEQLAARRKLMDKGLMPRPQVLALEERAVDIRGQIGVKTAEIAQARAEIASLQRERSQATADFRAQAAAEKAEAEAIVATRQEGVRKAEQRGRFQALLAPVAGTIHEISVATLSEVAEAGEPLVTIVPEGDELVVEALVLNLDAGFVRETQDVIVKLDAYPFTRYGHLEGVVERMSPDAVSDERLGLVFPARVRLTKTALRGAASGSVSERRPDVSRTVLSSGMSAQVEIVTGRRRVMEYVLSPVARAVGEAGRER